MNILIKNLKSSEFFDEAWKLYEESFPESEKRTLEEQKILEENLKYNTLGFIDNNKLVAILFYWDFSTHNFVEHFAVNKELRGKSYGSKILEIFLSSHKNVVLEIEEIYDLISEKRLRFYEKFGFVVNDYEHYQVPFRKNQDELKLLFLSHKNYLSKQEYTNLYSEMKKYLTI